MVRAVGAEPVHGGVVEVGAGTGAFTGQVMATLDPDWFVALEPNPRLAARLRRRHPSVVVVEAWAEHLGRVLSDRGLDRAQVVVSGLPFAAWSARRQGAALDGITEALVPGGRFVTFGYLHSQLLPGARRLRAALRERFDDVRVRGWAWWNLPPALVWSGSRPGGG